MINKSYIYEPQEDSYMLKDAIEKFLKKNKCELCLDLGCGSGIQGINMIEHCTRVVCSDVNEDAIKHVKNTTRDRDEIKVIKSNLFDNLSEYKKSFDLIAFNPPYLPREEDEEDDLALTSGVEGINITKKFIEDSKEYLKENGRLIFVVSSLSNVQEVHEALEKNNYEYKVLESKHFFFEDVMIYEAKPK